jgi:hypothetical protein|tara:strand:- start:5955 stop:6296 length:342 start_codon:yes stop_codon:yes gene_type:complete
MPVLDGIKAKLAAHLETLVSKMSIGTAGGAASSRDGGAGNVAFSVTPTVQRIDDRTVSISGIFDTSLISANDIKEVAVHGATPLDSPAFRTSFMPISKNATNEIRVDVIMEVR